MRAVEVHSVFAHHDQLEAAVLEVKHYPGMQAADVHVVLQAIGKARQCAPSSRAVTHTRQNKRGSRHG